MWLLTKIGKSCSCGFNYDLRLLVAKATLFNSKNANIFKKIVFLMTVYELSFDKP